MPKGGQYEDLEDQNKHQVTPQSGAQSIENTFRFVNGEHAFLVRN